MRPHFCNARNYGIKQLQEMQVRLRSPNGRLSKVWLELCGNELTERADRTSFSFMQASVLFLRPFNWLNQLSSPDQQQNRLYFFQGEKMDDLFEKAHRMKNTFYFSSDIFVIIIYSLEDHVSGYACLSFNGSM